MGTAKSARKSHLPILYRHINALCLPYMFPNTKTAKYISYGCLAFMVCGPGRGQSVQWVFHSTFSTTEICENMNVLSRYTTAKGYTTDLFNAVAICPGVNYRIATSKPHRVNNYSPVF